jgi:hypothetical protein
MKTSEQIDLISTALSLAQGEMGPASKSTENPFFKSKYANLNQIWDALKIPLSKNKLSVFQDLVTTDKGISVTTRVSHASGQWIEFGPLEIPSQKKDAQGLGSAASYGRRYALSAALGVVSEDDDDGNAACSPVKTHEPQKKEAPKPKEILSQEMIDEHKRKEREKQPLLTVEMIVTLTDILQEDDLSKIREKCLKLFGSTDLRYLTKEVYDVTTRWAIDKYNEEVNDEG